MKPKIQIAAPMFLYSRQYSGNIRVLKGDPSPITSKQVKKEGGKWVDVPGTEVTGVQAEHILNLCEDFTKQSGLTVNKGRAYQITLSILDVGPIPKGV